MNKHGQWILTAHDDKVNSRWHVTAQCSECGEYHYGVWRAENHEIFVGVFPDFPTDIAESTVLIAAKSVKLDNYCHNCGAKMDGLKNADL